LHLTRTLKMKLLPLTLIGLGLVLGNPVVDLSSSEICNDEQNTFYPDYADGCHSYYECVNGRKILFACPANLLWNENINTCDYPSAVTCKASSLTTSPPTPTTTPPTTPEETTTPPTTPEETTSQHTTPEETTSEHTTQETPTTKPVPSGDKKVVCYFTNWAWYRPGDGKFMPKDIDASLCTHIMYAFAELSNNKIIPYDSWADIDNKFYEQVVALKAQGKKVFISIGGWNDSAGSKYGTMVANPATRKEFIDSAVAFCVKYGFDGLGLDWEYPGCPQGHCSTSHAADKKNFAQLVEEAGAVFKQHNLGLSAAISPSSQIIDAGLDIPTLNKHLEWFSVMCFDYHGPWDMRTGHISPIYGYKGDGHPNFNVNYTINYLIDNGLSRDRLVMGMPLYGKSFTLSNQANHGLNAPARAGTAGPYTRMAGTLAYYEICEALKQGGWTTVQDPQKRMGPYIYRGNQWISYDDTTSLTWKTQFIKDYDLAGAMVWDLAYDDFHNNCGHGKNPMMTVIRDQLQD